MFDGEPYRQELRRRFATMRKMLDAADPTNGTSPPLDISRETRGLVVLLMFAAYENLMTSICRGLLERAASLRVGNRRLRPGIRQFAVHNLLVSISNSSEKKMWQVSGRELLSLASDGRRCTIDSNVFPGDGSFMKRSQVTLIFDLFELGDPGAILKEVWTNLDGVVVRRNRIAHGELTPEEVGREYSSADIRSAVISWETRWIELVTHIEGRASTREFYRL